MFLTSNGRAQGATNIRRRVLAPAVKLANERLGDAGEVPLPAGLTPHKLRHTAISLWFAYGYEMPRVKKMAGHATANVTLGIYRHVMDTMDDQARGKLRELVGGGFIGQQSGSSPVVEQATTRESVVGTAGFEPATSRV